jgi:hypothetical protein
LVVSPIHPSSRRHQGPFSQPPHPTPARKRGQASKPPRRPYLTRRREKGDVGRRSWVLRMPQAESGLRAIVSPAASYSRRIPQLCASGSGCVSPIRRRKKGDWGRRTPAVGKKGLRGMEEEERRGRIPPPAVRKKVGPYGPRRRSSRGGRRRELEGSTEVAGGPSGREASGAEGDRLQR